MKRQVWDAWEQVVSRADDVLGQPWRVRMRPHSGAITGYLRVLRFATRFYRFDGAGTRCALGRNVRFWGSVNIHVGDRSALLDDVIIAGGGTVRLGSGSSIGEGTVVVSWEAITIGRDVMVAGRCYILDVDHSFAALGTAIRDQDIQTSPVRIGDDVWVGAHTVILRGCTIGDGAVIGANSVVTRDIPANVIAAGNPARVIRSRS
ncbi:MAG: acyltransferase [Acidimicrobiales bacterium]